MNISHIAAFLSVVDTGSFSRAAEALYTTQATVSKQIQALEKELCVSLFDRRHRIPELTEHGKVFLAYARGFIQSYQALKEDLAHLSCPRSVSLSFVSIPTMAHYGLINLINELKSTYPSLQLTIDEREGSDIFSALESGEYELAFARLNNLDEKKYEAIELYRERLGVLLPAAHPLAERGSIPLRALKEENFLSLSPQTALYDFFIDACRQYGGFTPKIGYVSTRPENIADMTGHGMGVSLMMQTPAQYLLRQQDSIRFVLLEEEIFNSVGFVWPHKQTLSPAAEFFAAFICRKLDDNPAQSAARR